MALSIVRRFLDLVSSTLPDFVIQLSSHVAILIHLTHTHSISVTWFLWLATAATITIGLTDRLNCNPQDPKNILYCDQLKTIVSLAWFIWFAPFLSSLCFVCYTIVFYFRALITVTFIIALIHRLRPGDRVDTRHAGNATSGRDEAP